MGDRLPGSSEPALGTPSHALTDPEPDPAVLERVHEHPDPGWRLLREMGILTISALVIAIIIKTFLIQAFYIPSGSMIPTLTKDDRILVNRLAYRFGDIERGDIVVFADPTPTAHDRGLLDGVLHWLGEGVGVVRHDDDDFIKRVIALPGETWEIRGGVTYVGGAKVDEPWVNADDPDTRSFGPQTVPDGMLFVMGDNRNHSGDSRFAPPGGLGYIPIDNVIGQAFVIIWPPSRMGWLH